MGLLTDLQKTFKSQRLIFIIGLVVAVIALYQYSRNKGAILSGMTNANANVVGENADMNELADLNNKEVVPLNKEGGLPSCASKPVMNPGELLPHDSNSEWAKLNPRASGDFQNVNLLRSGYWNGIDTVGSSLRNANLQVRSEPPNPQNPVSIWNTSTISPDLMRVPLEIGQGGQ